MTPDKLPKGAHGKLIWERPMTGGESLKGAKNYLVDYKQVGVRGTMVPVSGMVAIPKGKAPKGGWPVITWAHGTTGIADVCAPSRLPAGTEGLNSPMLESWIKAGYAVVRTDYEGLGGPGPHPYLIGASEGRGVLDIVRAARQLDRQLSDRVVISGHSQGGHAALWAASLVKSYTPEIRLRGVLAFAPASHIATEVGYLKSVTATSLTGLAATILRGLDVGYPSLHISSLLTSKGAALYPQTLTKCLGQLDEPGLVRRSATRPAGQADGRHLGGGQRPAKERPRRAEDRRAGAARAGQLRHDSVAAFHRGPGQIPGRCR